MIHAQHDDFAKRPGTLLISPHLEPPIVRLQELLGGKESLDVFISNPVKVQGDKRSLLRKLRYYWIDPLLTMFKLLPRIHQYAQVICYYHRTGYWVGIYRLLFSKGNPQRSVWIGFAPIQKSRGIKGWLKEKITYLALRGHTAVICNSRPLVESLKRRFPLVRDRLAFVRWGGGDQQQGGSVWSHPGDGLHEGDYVFCGGRTNRDFETVLTAVRELGCPAVFAVAKDYEFEGHVPENVKVYRDISAERFQSLVADAGVVVIALDKPDISSGQVVLSRAMQCAKPIIVTQLAGIDDYVTDGRDALVVRPHDPTDLAEKIRLLLTSEGLRNELCASAYRRYVTDFNSDTFARDILAVLSVIDGWQNDSRSDPSDRLCEIVDSGSRGADAQ